MMRCSERIRIPEMAACLLLVMLLCQPSPLFACDDKLATDEAAHSDTMKAKTMKAELPKKTAAADVSPKSAKTKDKVKDKSKGKQAADAPDFNMDVLIERVKKTDAIGVFSKLALRSDALDLMGMVKAWRRHVKKLSLDDVRSQYDGLLLKILALLNGDPALSRDISMAREQIWQSLLEVKT